MAWLSGWTNRKVIIIAHTDDGAQTNYQLKLLVGESAGATGEQVDCNSKVASDFDDLRFTTSDGTTLCDYWIESISGATPNQLATVWIEVPSIAAHPNDTTIYMYYGGTTTAVSNGVNTFLLFDHFDGANLNLDIWTLGDGSVTQTNSIATLVWVSTSNFSQIYSDTTFGANYRWRSLAKYASNSAYTSLGFKNTNDYGTIFQTNYPSSNVLYALNRNPYPTETSSNLGDISENVYAIYEIKRNSTTNVIYNINNITKATLTTNIPSTSVPVWYEGYGQVVYIDWVFVSIFTATEPTWGSFGSEETEGTILEFSETLSIVDTKATSGTLVKAETLSIVDTKATSGSLGLLEILSIVDTWTAIITFLETLSIIDSEAMSGELDLDETLGIVDSAVCQCIKTLYETLSIIDSKVTSGSLSLAETLSIADSWTVLKNFFESLSIVDTVTMDGSLNVSEIISIIDSFIRWMEHPIFTEPTKGSLSYTEPTKTNPVYTKPAKGTTSFTKPAKTNPVYTEPIKGHPIYTEPTKKSQV